MGIGREMEMTLQHLWVDLDTLGRAPIGGLHFHQTSQFT